ncbi:MAG: glycosyltransferase family 2 protein [Solirubrobacterales bacterium]|nr:glycosyltransferase family 2 protein [Solirubrobacterales bacterium]
MTSHMHDARPRPRPPTVSVVICAYTEERWDDLLDAVDSCRTQTLAPLETIVVIDHNPALLARLRDEHPDVRGIANAEERGLSGARNSGISVSRGDVVAFVDDDATAAPDWLEHLTAGYVDETVIGAGGLIAPVWPHQRRPASLPPEFDWVVGCSYRGLPETTTPVRNMIGANMSLRREVFDAVGGFRCGMGRIGTVPLGCEETELCIRARRELPSSVILFEPRAMVHHRVPPQRLGWRYFRSRCYAEGLSKAAVTDRTGSRDGLATERSYTLRTLPLGVLRGIGDALIRGDPAGLARSLAIVCGLLVTSSGYAVGLLRGHS